MTMPTIESLAADIGFDLPARYNASRLLWDNLAQNADAPAVITDAGVWSYAALAAEAARIGNALAAKAAPGERVLLFLDDEPAYPAAIMGAMRAGLVPVLLNTLSPPDLVAFFAEDSGARIALVSDAFTEVFAGLPLEVWTTGARPWADAPAELAEAPTTRRDPAFWMYSSGSTGRPKGVVHKHEDPAYVAASYGAHVLGLARRDIVFSVPKIFFAYGFGNSVIFPMAAGAAAVLMAGRPEPGRIFEAIARHRPGVFFGLPTLYTALCHDPGAAAADLSSLHSCISAAEILSEDIANAWKRLTGLPVIEGLGSTEVLHIYLSNDRSAQVPGAAGRAVPGYAIRLVDPDGHEAAPGAEGVMQVRGLSVTEGYWNRPDKTAESLRDGWLHTGDRFEQDEAGNYFFKGRADDLVKVSGQWVWPMEIEVALNAHPAVREACVLAVELPDRRMTIRAHVAPAAGATPGPALAAALKDHAKAQLLPHKYPREIVWMDNLPKTGTGKIDRQALRNPGA